ncbi:hypothetical protein V6N12_009429 [Hibiscus sabdariffa]|uniref:Uncharacterized protein n=1 Tax=Hibiscus sabdariffa TaxID=183260 RepID=A0ABR2E936_9ROSI
MLFSHGWWHPYRPILCAWLFGESSVGRCVAWIALCRVISTYVVGKTGDPFPIQYVQLSVWPSAPGWLLITACGVRLLPPWELKLRLVQSLIGLRFAALVGAARREPNALPYLPMHAHVLPGCVLWSVVCVGLHCARAWPIGPCAWPHHRPRTAPPEWRQALRVYPTQLFSSATADVILCNKVLVCAAGNHFWWHCACWFCATSPLRPRRSQLHP